MKPQDSPFAPLPPWLLEYIETEVPIEVKLTQENQLPEEDWVTEALKGVKKGERHNTALKLAGFYLGKGEPEPRVLELLHAWNLRNFRNSEPFFDKEPEPLPDEELQAVVASIARKEARKRIRAEAAEGKPGPDAAAASNLSSEEQRQAGIQGLGERLGLPLTDIKVTKSDDSIFEFFLEEAESVIVTAAQLCQQRLFKSRFVAAGLIVPKKVKESKGGAGGGGGGEWDEVVRQMIGLATYRDVGRESSTLGELREFLNTFVEGYRGLVYFSPNQTIPNHLAFFVVHRKNEKPKLYCRVSELFLEAKAYGYRSIKKLTVLLPSLGHKSGHFSWKGQTIRAWNMNLDGMSQEIKEMVYKKAIEGKERESSHDDG